MQVAPFVADMRAALPVVQGWLPPDVLELPLRVLRDAERLEGLMAEWAPGQGPAQVCHGCGCLALKMKLCSGCKCVRFCSKDCLTRNWKGHKHSCKLAPHAAAVGAEFVSGRA